jgi:excisionase family DNA binding protein
MPTTLLTARAVAEQLGVSSESVLRWTRRGTLPGFRLPGGALRYREDDLARWLAERATPGGEVSAAPTSAALGVD